MTKQPKPERPKNASGAAANREKAISALCQKLCLALTYDGLPRIVEVHTVGTTRADRPAMSVYQVGGQTHEGSVTDWRTMCFDECFDVALSDNPSAAPRPNYRRGAKTFKRIDFEV